jgi:hypothetical protein
MLLAGLCSEAVAEKPTLAASWPGREARLAARGHESGWAIGVYAGWLVTYENVDELDVEPRHLQVGAERPQVLRLMRAAAEGDLATLEAQPCSRGYGAPLAIDLVPEPDRCPVQVAQLEIRRLVGRETQDLDQSYP